MSRRPALLASALLLLAGCNPGPKYHAPAPPAIAAQDYKESSANFKDADGWKVASPGDAMLRGKWWEIYQDPELNALEEQVAINNQNIRGSFENFMSARTQIAQARSQYWPTVTTSPSWQRSTSSQNVTGSNAANPGRSTSEWSFPLSVSWEPDLWGKIRNQVHEAQYGAQVSAADLENERLSEQSSLAQYYFEICGQDALQAILNDTVAADQKALDLTRTQYETGVGDRIAVVQAESTLESAKATAVNLGVARAQYEHAIATLIGKPATNFSLPVRPLLRAAPPIPVGVPSQLLERRPDVAAAERTLAEANATIGFGYGAFFPSVDLAAEGGFESSLLKHAFDWPSRFWSLGPSVSQTIFNGGLYTAELHQYTATYNADLASYRQTVLTAFQQVEDSLAAVRLESQQVENQQRAVDRAQQALDFEMGRYETGVDPYIDFVTAQNTLLADRQSLATTQIEEMTASVELIAALGGGWDRNQLPTPKQVSAKPAKGDYRLQR
ncbi:efflux transporter outer membrane subunit [Silvibacterium acidisoli]|uniref:efflux transporter outer membrane subunit n=1 Tax=Acidobacteriaceae bacterium ZG23-2 TaxID=2883246 RepID=UPI00406C55A0